MLFTLYLDWSWAKCEYFISGSFGITIHVNKNMNTIGVNTISSFSMARDGRQIDKMLCISFYLPSETCSIISRESIAEYLGKIYSVHKKEIIHTL